MPGYGESTGRRSAFRSSGEHVLDEVVEAVNPRRAPFVLIGRSVGGPSVFAPATSG